MIILESGLLNIWRTLSRSIGLPVLVLALVIQIMAVTVSVLGYYFPVGYLPMNCNEPSAVGDFYYNSSGYHSIVAVFDANGNPVSDASVRLNVTTASESYIATGRTNGEGLAILTVDQPIAAKFLYEVSVSTGTLFQTFDSGVQAVVTPASNQTFGALKDGEAKPLSLNVFPLWCQKGDYNNLTVATFFAGPNGSKELHYFYYEEANNSLIGIPTNTSGMKLGGSTAAYFVTFTIPFSNQQNCVSNSININPKCYVFAVFGLFSSNFTLSSWYDAGLPYKSRLTVINVGHFMGEQHIFNIYLGALAPVLGVFAPALVSSGFRTYSEGRFRRSWSHLGCLGLLCGSAAASIGTLSLTNLATTGLVQNLQDTLQTEKAYLFLLVTLLSVSMLLSTFMRSGKQVAASICLILFWVLAWIPLVEIVAAFTGHYPFDLGYVDLLRESYLLDPFTVANTLAYGATFVLAPNAVNYTPTNQLALISSAVLWLVVPILVLVFRIKWTASKNSPLQKMTS